MSGFLYTVRRGDCMISIAAQYGFDWQILWAHPQNQELKELRKNPNVLLEGDQVYIPERTAREVSCATDKRHSFVRKGPSTLRLRLMGYGRPRKNIRYSLQLGHLSCEGQPDKDGYVEATIPAGVTSGSLVIHDGDISEVHTLLVGHLDPIDDIKGIQQRLVNLGMSCLVSGVFDDQTRHAIQTEIRGTPLHPCWGQCKVPWEGDFLSVVVQCFSVARDGRAQADNSKMPRSMA